MSETPTYRESNQWSDWAKRSRHLILAALVAGPTTLAACGSGSDQPPSSPPKGWGCISILDQQDRQMDDCTFDYEPPAEGKANDNCSPGQLYAYGSPGTFKVNAECGKLTGYVSENILEGANDLCKSRLVGSFCSDGQELVADPLHQIVSLNDRLGTSTATRCANFYDNLGLRTIEVASMLLDCGQNPGDAGTEADGSSEGGADASANPDCDPIDGRNYLTPLGTLGQTCEGSPIHLTFKAATELVPDNGEVKVKVTVRQTTGTEQELTVPIFVRGRKTAEQDAGTDSLPDAGLDAGNQD